MKVLSLCAFFILILSCESKPKHQVFLVKQWHLSPLDRTLNIEKSKKLPQFENQMDIYRKVSKMVEKGETRLIIAEGCQGEIRVGFKKIFNGWSLSRLKMYKDRADFDQILAPVPMKLKVKFPSLIVLCGDSNELIKENQRAMSDLRGFAGFYTRLLDLQQTDKMNFKVYAHQLKQLYPKENITKPIEFALKKANNSLKLFEQMIVARNQAFYNLAQKYLNQNPVVIVGGLHVSNLEDRFREGKIPFKTIVPKGYANDGHKLIKQLKENLNAGSSRLIKFFQVPQGFDLKRFKWKKQLDKTKLFSAKELSQMNELIKDKLPMEIITSDFDGDGIRDFTISQDGELIYISAEDPDWDNDNIPNIIDTTLGEEKIGEKDKVRIHNAYQSRAKEFDILSSLKNKVEFVSYNKVGHELLVLEIYAKMLEKFKKQKFGVKFLVATNPTLSYGKNVFFSYVPQSQSLEYYPKKLQRYIEQQYQRRFKGADYNKYINSYVVPLLVHSMGHELGHALDADELKLAKAGGWSWAEKLYNGKYLSQFRLSKKIIKSLKTKVLFKNKAYKDWLAEHDKFQKDIKANIKKGGSKEAHDYSFLKKHGLPSVYALAKPSEWFAEMYSMCLYQKVYPESQKMKRAVELEHLLGIYPLAAGKEFCSNFSL